MTLAARVRTTGSLALDLVLPDNTAGGSTAVSIMANALYSAVGKYFVGFPWRVLDTRKGLGAPKHPVAGGTSIHVAIGGKVGYVPKTGVRAVVLNLTVTGPTSGGYVTAYPTGSTRPTASNINFPRGWTGANQVTVAPNAAGSVDFYLSAGSANLVADVVGWYADTPTATTLAVPWRPVLPPARIADTRYDGGRHVKLPGGYYTELGVSFNGITSSQVKAIVVNLTVTGVSKTGGYVTIYGADNGNYSWLETSTLNPRAHESTPNLAIVPVVSCWRRWCQGLNYSTYRVYNGTSHPIDFVVDVVGVYSTTHNPGNATFRALPSTARIVDTRIPLGASPFGAGTTRTVSPPSDVAGFNTAALVANVTAVKPTVNTYLTAWPKISGFPRPTVSNINPVAGRTVANAANITVGDSEDFNLYNYAGHTDALVDVVGTFENFPEILPGGAGFAGARASTVDPSRATQPLVAGFGQSGPRPAR